MPVYTKYQRTNPIEQIEVTHARATSRNRFIVVRNGGNLQLAFQTGNGLQMTNAQAIEFADELKKFAEQED